MTEISVFVPVYNEEKRLEKNIKRIYDKLSELKYDFELFIVNDNSKDKTEEVGKRLVHKLDRLRMVSYNRGPSRRENLAKSFQHAKGDIVVFMDADIATDLASVDKLVTAVRKGYDVATGSRYHKKSKLKRTVKRYLISIVYNTFMKVYFGSRVKDHQCGFKAFKRGVAKELIRSMGYDSKYRRGWFWDAEFLIRAQKRKKRIKEIPVKWIEAETSTFNVSNEIKMIPHVLKLRFRL